MGPISALKKLALGSAAIVAASAVFAGADPAAARVTKIVIDAKVSPAFNGESFGTAGQYETLAGRAFGELDPSDKQDRKSTRLNSSHSQQSRMPSSA